MKHVICFDPSTGNETTIENADCRYGYRDSVFKHPEGKNLIVTGVVLALSPTPKPNRNYAALAAAFKDTADEKLTPADFRNEILRLRTAKLPDPLNAIGKYRPNSAERFPAILFRQNHRMRQNRMLSCRRHGLSTMPDAKDSPKEERHCGHHNPSSLSTPAAKPPVKMWLLWRSA